MLRIRSIWRLLSALLIVGIVPTAAASGAGASFEYGGLTLGTQLGGLRQKYSSSTFSERSVRLSQTDSHDDIHFIEKRTFDGKDELRIVFETPHDELKTKPASWTEEHYARFPKCEAILGRLIRAYGEPHMMRTGPEERLSHRVRTWSTAREEMILDCYNIDGKGALLAAELTIRSK